MTSPKNKNLNELFLLFEDECRYIKRLSESTIITYKSVFKHFRTVINEIEYASDLNGYFVTLFFKRVTLQKKIKNDGSIKRGVKDSTIKSYYNRLIVFFRWLENNGFVNGLVNSIPKPREPRYEDIKSLDKTEISQIISAIVMKNIDNQYLHKRDLLIINTFLYTGMRRGELLGLQTSDINFDTRSIKVRAETSKSRKSRNIPLHPLLMVLLKDYLKYRNKLALNSSSLFISSKNTPLTVHGLKHWVKRYQEASGVEFHLHRFRHTFACSLARNKANIISIKNALGHSTIKMTERYLRSIKSENSRSDIELLSF